MISGDQTINVFGQPAARKGDMVTCPQCKGTFPIVEGAMACGSDRLLALEGMRTACGAVLIASQQFWTELCAVGSGSGSDSASTSATPEEEPNKRLVPGKAQVSFYIQDMRRPIGIGRLAHELLADRKPEHVRRFIKLNSHLGRYAQFGSIVMVSSDYDQEIYAAESRKLMREVQEVESLRAKLSATNVQTLVDNWDLLAYAVVQEGDSVVGSAALFFKQQRLEITRVLSQLESSAQDSLKRSGSLNDAQFRAERAKLLAQLDIKFNRMVMARAGVPDQVKLSAALNLSSKSVTNIWRKGGSPIYISRQRQIVEWFGKYERVGTNLGLAFVSTKAGVEIYDVCSDDASTRKECVVTAGAEVSGVAGGLLGGAAGAAGGIAICAYLAPAGGVPALVCAAGVVGAALLGGELGSNAGKYGGGNITRSGYEIIEGLAH